MLTGIIYCLSGDPIYKSYLKASIRSLRNQGYAGPISVVTDQALNIQGVNVIPPRVYSSPKELKVMMGFMSPYDKSLYLDCDVYAMAPFDDIWSYLDGSDLAMVLGGIQSIGGVRFGKQEERDYTVALCGPTSPHYNSGVILWNKTQALSTFWMTWHAEWTRFSDVDELALARALSILNQPVVGVPSRFNFMVDARFRRPIGATLWHDASYMKYAPTLYPELFTA